MQEYFTETEYRDLKIKSLEILTEIALFAAILDDELKANFNPNQPRVPAGYDNGGQWTDGGDYGTPSRKPNPPKPRIDKTPSEQIQVTEIFFLEKPPIVIEQIRPRPPIGEVVRPTSPAKQPFEYPTNPSKPPGPDWQWGGKGPPGSPKGSWYNRKTGERIYRDMDHPPPKGPHHDYKAPDGKWYRWYPDGRMEPKIVIGDIA